MRAVVVEAHGGPEVLQVTDRDDPTAGDGELLVEVAAAGVNYMDVYGREGRPPYGGDTPWVPGAEGAGRVRAVGAGVNGVVVGDRVAWAAAPGSYAELAVVPAEKAVPVPDGVDVRTAAALMLQGLTAHYLATTTYPVRPGDVVVVHAAAGGVGLLLTQIATMRGATVVATTSGGEKAALAQGAGAAHVAGYDDYLDVVRDVTSGSGAAVVYDGVGAATLDASLAALRRRGVMVSYGSASGPIEAIAPAQLTAAGSLFFTRPTLADHVADRDELTARTDELFGWVSDGALDVRVGETYPLDDVRRAHEDLEGRRTTGKLLLLPGDSDAG